jgi:LCP family protein required for cell wall assembly
MSGRRLRRRATLAVVLTLLAVLVPDAGRRVPDAVLVKVDGASGLDTEPGVVWVLALGSDARPGERLLRSRSDAIQLVGFNARTGDATVIGIPRDSYVDIPGYGSAKINDALSYGGPQVSADAVAQLVGVAPDYVFVTGFEGFKRMVEQLGGGALPVRSPRAFTTLQGSIRAGVNRLGGGQSLALVRERYDLPNGDFDRSLNQARFLVDGLRAARTAAQDHGQLERLLAAFLEHTDIDVGPVELYRLAQAVLAVDPAKVSVCVVRGSIGYAGAASVVFPDVEYARSLVSRAGADARLEGGC